ncbi:MAG: hypothetical protein SWK76_16625 [Actinomycetota bacterium]|nr:hypothetical protein [Actinomycetota bacterium]
MAKQCKKCGVPPTIHKTHVWRDGCIVDKGNGAANFCVYEASFHNDLMDKVGDHLWLPMDDVVFNVGRHASTRVIRDLLSSHPLMERIAFKAPFYHLSQQILVDFGKAMGTGDIEILEHRKGKYGSLIVRAPYNPAHGKAIIAGAIDAVYGYPVCSSINEEADSFTLELVPDREDVKTLETFSLLTAAGLAPQKLEPGYEMPTCKRCGTPLVIGDSYDFDIEKGVITEKASGERTVFIWVYSLNAIIREFGKELGQDIEDLFIAVERENFARKLSKTLWNEDLWGEDRIRQYLAQRGLGMLHEVYIDGDKISFMVKNSFIAPIVTGRLLALWEREHQADASYKHTVINDNLKLTITPK